MKTVPVVVSACQMQRLTFFSHPYEGLDAINIQQIADDKGHGRKIGSTSLNDD